MPLPERYDLVSGAPDVGEYVALRIAAGLSPKTGSQASRAIAGTWYFCHVRDRESGQLVAMGRVIGDGGWYFHIADIATHPDHQGQGIGSAVMDTLTARIHAFAPADPYITLIADPPGIPLYKAKGFVSTAPSAAMRLGNDTNTPHVQMPVADVAAQHLARRASSLCYEILGAHLPRDRALTALERDQPGFRRESYEAALDAAMRAVEARKQDVRTRRANLVDEARQRDLLDAVFALRYFNRRYSDHVGQLGLGPIDITHVLADMFSAADIAVGMRRADALINQGCGFTYERDAHEDHTARLRLHHPGFDDRSLGQALDWGYFSNR